MPLPLPNPNVEHPPSGEISERQVRENSRKVQQNFEKLAAHVADIPNILELVEVSEAPPAPEANRVRIYAKDTGEGKTRLYALFSSGEAQTIATQP